MVRLDRIYTRAGDDGLTSLGDGERVSKNDARIWAYGAVDETGAAIGVAVATGLEQAAAELLRRVQNDLFDLGADLAVPAGQHARPGSVSACASASRTWPRSRPPATATWAGSRRSPASCSPAARSRRRRCTWPARCAGGRSGSGAA